MYDTMSRMGGFLPQLDIAVRIDIETCARRLQFAHTRRPFFDEHLHRFRIAEGGTSRQRVPPLKPANHRHQAPQQCRPVRTPSRIRTASAS